MFERFKFIQFPALAALMLCTSACGAPPNHVTKRDGGAVAARSQAAVDKQVDAASLIDGLRKLYAKVNTFYGTISMWEHAGDKVQTTVADVYSARPRKLRVNVTDSSEFLRRSAQLLYLGDKKIKIRLGFFTQTLPYDDHSILTLHGWRVDQTDLNSLVEGLTDPTGKFTAQGEETINGIKTQKVSVVSPTMLPGVTSEVVALDPKTFIPVRIDAFILDEVVYRLEVFRPQLNPTLPPEVFEL